MKYFPSLQVKDPRYHAEKITQKDAKNIYEHTLKLEGEYQHLLSDTVPAAANLMLITHQIQSKIDQEQNKTLWVPSGTIWWRNLNIYLWVGKKLSVFAVVHPVKIIDTQSLEQKDHPIKFIFFPSFLWEMVKNVFLWK